MNVRLLKDWEGSATGEFVVSGEHTEDGGVCLGEIPTYTMTAQVGEILEGVVLNDGGFSFVQ